MKIRNARAMTIIYKILEHFELFLLCILNVVFRAHTF